VDRKKQIEWRCREQHDTGEGKGQTREAMNGGLGWALPRYPIFFKKTTLSFSAQKNSPHLFQKNYPIFFSSKKLTPSFSPQKIKTTPCFSHQKQNISFSS
jgi:hypothetical protein